MNLRGREALVVSVVPFADVFGDNVFREAVKVFEEELEGLVGTLARGDEDVADVVWVYEF